MNNPLYNPHLQVATHRSAGFYFSIFFASLFYFGFGTGVLAIAFDETPPSYLLIIISLGLMALGVYTLYMYYKNTPKVKADSSGIQIGNTYHHWEDIAELFFTGKQPFRYIGKFPMEGAMILFKDGTKIFLFDSMYTNLWAIKSTVRQSLQADSRYAHVLEDAGYAPNKKKEQLAQPDMTSTTDSSSRNFQYFKGNQFTNFRGMILWGGLLLMVWAMVELNDSATTVLLCFPGAGWFVLWSFQLNYFGVSENYIIVKNHNFFWKRKIYPLADIDRVVLDSQGNSANSLTLMLSNMQTKSFQGPTLRGRDWIALKKLLESKHIRLKDENSFEEMEKPAMKKMTRKLYVYLIIYLIIVMALYMYVTSLQVSDGIMTLLKLLWIVLMVAGLIGVMVLAAKSSDDPPR